MKSIVTAGLLAAAVLAAPAHAATIEVVSGQQRAFTLGAFGNSAGQSFIAVDSALTAFGFQFRQFVANGNLAAPNVDYIFTLLNGAGLNGTAITTRSFTVPTTLSSTVPSWIDLDITGANVVVGQVYTAVLSSTNIKFGLVMGPDINIFSGQELSGDAYAGGRAYFARDPYPNCARTGNCDLNFRVSGNSATAQLPEPTSWAMMLGGFALAGGTLRRHRAALRSA